MRALPCLMEPPHSSSFINWRRSQTENDVQLGSCVYLEEELMLSSSLVYLLCSWDILLNSHFTSMNPISNFSLPALLPIKIFCIYLFNVSLSLKFYSRKFDSITYFFYELHLFLTVWCMNIRVLLMLIPPPSFLSPPPPSCLVFFWDPMSLIRAFSVSLGLERSIGIKWLHKWVHWQQCLHLPRIHQQPVQLGRSRARDPLLDPDQLVTVPVLGRPTAGSISATKWECPEPGLFWSLWFLNRCFFPDHPVTNN